jgi:hypothetical protein
MLWVGEVLNLTSADIQERSLAIQNPKSGRTTSASIPGCLPSPIPATVPSSERIFKRPQAIQSIEGCQYRIPVPFRCLSVVLRHGKEKFKDILLGDAGEITLAKKSLSKSAEHKLTCLDGIFFELALWYCRWKSTALDTFMVHLLWMGSCERYAHT